MSLLPSWLNQLLPILVLLAAVAIVLARLPRVELGHSDAFRRRRFLNWFPLGLTYAFLYMGRYNLNVAANALIAQGELTKDGFGTIGFWGSMTYGVAFLLNGPLADRWGGRATILISSAGAAVMNLAMGLALWALMNGWQSPLGIVPLFSVLYGLNMYFQSFGAVSIVKVNAPWFHVRERGVLGGVFGILISLGLYFAYDWSAFIAKNAPLWWVFIVPAIVLGFFFVVDLFVIRNTPVDAGHRDFDTEDASSGDDGPRLGVFEVGRRMLTHPVMLTIIAIEFCSGYLRNAIMQWFKTFATQTGQTDSFVNTNWGMLLCVAGILGGVFAGLISDRVFDSRRGPVSAVLYGGMTLGAVAAIFALETPLLGWVVVFMSLCVIGVHGMLSGTASMDFGGRKNAGVAVGIIDGAVYLGTAFQYLLLGKILPTGEVAKDPGNWYRWPLAMLPLTVLGLVLAARVWNAKPAPKKSLAPLPIPVAGTAATSEVATRDARRA